MQLAWADSIRISAECLLLKARTSGQRKKHRSNCFRGVVYNIRYKKFICGVYCTIPKTLGAIVGVETSFSSLPSSLHTETLFLLLFLLACGDAGIVSATPHHVGWLIHRRGV